MKFSDMNKALVNKLIGKRVDPSIGGDPEFFVADKRGKVLSADKFFPGKHDPLFPSLPSKCNKLFFDGIQGEIAINHGTCRDDLISNTRSCLSMAVNKIPGDHHIVLKPSAKIDRSVIAKADPEARMFGCEPDFNAYTRSVNTKEVNATKHKFRYAGGHIHLGMSSGYLKEGDPEYDMVHRDENHLRIVKFLDLLVSIPTLMLDNGQGSKRRRDMYGKAGCFRPTPYGVEYRTPSCWWLRSPMTVSLVFGLAKLAWTMLVYKLDKDFCEAIGSKEEDVRGIIDESDTTESYKVWKKMRPYITIAGKPHTNPLSMTSAKVHRRPGSAEDLEFLPPMKDIINKMPIFYGTPIYPLAVFEYALRNGIGVITDKDINKEWCIGKCTGDSFRGSNGFVVNSSSRFNTNKDFLKFQDSLIKELY